MTSESAPSKPLYLDHQASTPVDPRVLAAMLPWLGRPGNLHSATHGASPCLFDRDSWRIDGGASDMAHLMTVHWYPDRRRMVERRLLDRYHAALMASGLVGYERRALDEDYRFSILWQITWPLSQAAGGVPPVIWWNNFERVTLAFDDHACIDLLR